MVLESNAGLFSIAANELTIASNGGATASFTGLMPGSTELRLAVAGTPLETFVLVIVQPGAPIVTSVETVPSASNDVDLTNAIKVLREGVLYIEHNGKCFTTTGMLVK